MPPKILAFAGSLRKGSWNKKLIHIAAHGARNAGVETTLIDLADYPMPLYDGDDEQAHGLPENAIKLKELFLEHQGLMLSCPEYNSSISAVLKNTIDWVSRPREGEKTLECFDGKICVLMSASPGNLGGLRGLVTVRSILGNIKVIVLPDQIAVSKANEAFNDDGTLKDEAQHRKIEALGATLATMVLRLHG